MQKQALNLPPTIGPFLAPYLPPPTATGARPFITLTYAASLDSNLSLAPGVQTALSGPESKALTHYLRTNHSGILIGASTAVADDPSLNSRLAGATLSHQPRPIVLDPHFRWAFMRSARVLEIARCGLGKAPFIFVSRGSVTAGDPRVGWLEEAGGKVVELAPAAAGERWAWTEILDVLGGLGVGNVMVEGGGAVINDLLRPENVGLVDTVVITVAPVYLGQGGVNVSPVRSESGSPAARFRDVNWAILGRDVVMAARPE